MNGVSTVELIVRMTASLLVIGGLLWLVQKMGRSRLGGLGRQTAAPLEITSRKQLTKASSVALIRAGERNLLIGVTDNGISLLAEGDDLVSNVQLLDSSPINDASPTNNTDHADYADDGARAGDSAKRLSFGSNLKLAIANKTSSDKAPATDTVGSQAVGSQTRLPAARTKRKRRGRSAQIIEGTQVNSGVAQAPEAIDLVTEENRFEAASSNFDSIMNDAIESGHRSDPDVFLDPSNDSSCADSLGFEPGTDQTELSTAVSPEIAALSRHWDTQIDPATSSITNPASSAGALPVAIGTAQGQPEHNQQSENDVARKPRLGAQSSTRSGTRALDALRDKTVRKV